VRRLQVDPYNVRLCQAQYDMSEALPILGTDQRVSKKVSITLGNSEGNPYSLETFIKERAKQY